MELSSGGKTQTAKLPDLPAGVGHTARIQRAGDKLTVFVNDQQLAEEKVDATARYGLELALENGNPRISSSTLPSAT